MSLVMEQEILNGVIGDHEVNPAVVIYVYRRYSEGLCHRMARPGIAHLDAGGGRNICEMTTAIVVVQIGENAIEIARRAVSAADIGQLKRGGLIQLSRPTDVVADEQIQLSVIVVIDPRGAGAPSIRSADDACL